MTLQISNLHYLIRTDTYRKILHRRLVRQVFTFQCQKSLMTVANMTENIFRQFGKPLII